MTTSYSSSWVTGGQPSPRSWVTPRVEAHCKTRAQAENALRAELKGTAFESQKGELTALHRFADAAELGWRKLRELVRKGAKSTRTVDIYERQLGDNPAPAAPATAQTAAKSTGLSSRIPTPHRTPRLLVFWLAHVYADFLNRPGACSGRHGRTS
jgi:hypothetical protein